MLIFNPVIELVNAPVAPVSSVLVINEIVGFAVISQQTPLAVTDPPLSSEIFPPDTAVVRVIDVIAFVVKTGAAI